MTAHAALTIDALGGCRLTRARGVEAVSGLPSWRVDVLAEASDVALDALVGQDATLVFGDDDGAVRTQILRVIDAAYAGPSRDGHRYALELSATVWQLGLRSGYAIFQAMTTKQIVAKVLETAGVPSSAVVWRLSGRYAEHEHCVQYGETDWGFIERLLANEGIAYWFDASEELGPLLCLGDTPSAHPDLAGGRPIRFEDPTGMSGTATSIHELIVFEELTHEGVHLLDYDVRRPAQLIEAQVGSAAREYFEFPACLPGSDAAAARAQVRLEQLQRFRVHATAKSACARLAPGRVLTIEGPADEALAGDYLVVEVRHEVEVTSRSEARDRPYANTAVLVRHGERAFRPAIPTAPPRVAGLETAVVTGPAGEEIHVDDLGAVKVRFFWDRSGITDDRSSRWVRTLQMNTHGAMMLPRVGWEVPVVYFDGNPDQPFVLGRVYNAETTVPFPLPASKATASIKTSSSPGGAGSHEDTLSDDAGAMKAKVVATRDQTVKVGHSSVTKVRVNETETFDKNRRINVHGTHTHDVTGKEKTTVAGFWALNCEGTRTELVGGMESIAVTDARLVKVSGFYTEVVGALYGLLANQSNVTVNGGCVQAVGGFLGVAAAQGLNETAAGLRAEQVGGMRVIVAKLSCEDKTLGVKKITSGAAVETAAADIITACKTLGQLNVGGAASFEAGTVLLFKSPYMFIDVKGTLLAIARGTQLEASSKAMFTGGVLVLDSPTVEKKATSEVKA